MSNKDINPLPVGACDKSIDAMSEMLFTSFAMPFIEALNPKSSGLDNKLFQFHL